MKIGYACLNIGVFQTNYKNCTMKNATRENLISIIGHNLNSLNNALDYNIKNNIKIFRISSDLIPFGSSPVNDIKWWELFANEFSMLGSKIKSSKMRVSMHAGQYTVLNSPHEDVVFKSIKDLNYHNKFLDSLGTGKDSKIVLHIGGVYGNKEKAIERFIHNYSLLSPKVKERLIIENDDKSYNIGDVLKIGKILDIPVVFDNLHNKVLPYDNSKDEFYFIKQCKKTWKKEDGTQKIHYSQQDTGKRPGSHSKTIDLTEFTKFINKLDDEIDIMLEVKDKNLSAIKCINSISKNKDIKNLEIEWSKYKYTVLEHSSSHYNRIREILKDKNKYPVIEFYNLIDEALNIEEDLGSVINAASHVWGYFKSISTQDEKKKWLRILNDYKKGVRTKNSLKVFLHKMALNYNVSYLIDSYYFDL